MRRYDRASRSMTQPVTTEEVVSAERENQQTNKAAKMKDEKERENREEKIAVDIRVRMDTHFFYKRTIVYILSTS